MQHQPRHRPPGILHLGRQPVRRQRSRVSDLAARLGIERGPVEQHLARGALLQRVGGLLRLPDQDGDDPRLGGPRGVPQPLDPHRADQVLQTGRDLDLAGADPGLARARPLLGHGALEPGLIQRQSVVRGDVPQEIHRKPVGVVEPEDLRPRDGGGPLGFLLLHHGLHQAESDPQRVAEPLLLGQRHPGDMLPRLGELRVGPLHQLHHPTGHLGHERLVHAEQATVAEAAPQDTAQHIAAALVAGQDAVGHQKRRGPGMIRDDPQRDVRLGAGTVADAGQILHEADDRPKEVGVEVARHPLQDRRQPLQTGAGVDAGPGQRGQHPVAAPLELHEHQVPQLQVPIAVTPHGAGRPPASHSRTLVVDDLGAGAARARIAHRPEVVLGGAGHNPGIRHVATPERARLLVRAEPHPRVALVNGGPQPLGRQAEGRRQEFPRKGDRGLLEIVAEREVPQHLEEGVVPRRPPHVFQVVVLAPGANALLRRDGASVRALLAPGEHILELHHPGVGEEQRGIGLRDQRGAGNVGVALAAEILHEGAADVIACLGRRGHGDVPVLVVRCIRSRYEIPWLLIRFRYGSLCRSRSLSGQDIL